MNKKSLLQSTLCGLLFAMTSTSMYAQKKDDIVLKNFNTSEYFDAIPLKTDTLPSIPAAGCVGLAVSHFNPVISIGFKMRKNKKYSDVVANPDYLKKAHMHPHRFSPYMELALYMPIKPFHEAHTKFYTGGNSPRLYDIGLDVWPLARGDMLISNDNFTFGGGLLLVDKGINGIPELSRNNKLVIGYTGIVGKDITSILTLIFPKIKNRFPMMKNHLDFVGTFSYVPKSRLLDELNSLPLVYAADHLDKNLFRISAGLNYWIK